MHTMKDAEQRGPDQIQKDKRRTLRRPLIVLRAKMDNGKKSFFGYAKNISRGGMFIASINPHEPGSKFQVEFPLPALSGNNVVCHCEVVWKRLFQPKGRYEPGMGLRFLDIPRESADAIETWVTAAE
jgi:hypothetical protein